MRKNVVPRGKASAVGTDVAHLGWMDPSNSIKEQKRQTVDRYAADGTTLDHDRHSRQEAHPWQNNRSTCDRFYQLSSPDPADGWKTTLRVQRRRVPRPLRSSVAVVSNLKRSSW
jgi:hypothetical protein